MFRAQPGPTNILTQSGNDIIDVGTYGTPWPLQWLQPPSPSLPSGVVNGIQGALTVVGDGSDVLNVTDTGSNVANTGTLGSNTLTGLGMGSGGVTYSGLALLNVFLGSGGNTFAVSSTNSGTSTNIDLQATTVATTITTLSGSDSVYIGSLAPANGGNLNSIRASVTVNGDGSDTLNVDNANGGPPTGTLTSSSLTGAGLGNGGIIHYNGLSTLNITLGNVGLTVASTASGTTTNINIQSAGGQTSVTTLSGATDTINIGSLAPKPVASSIISSQ